MDNIIELLTQADETSLNISDTLAAEGASPAVKTIFMGLLTVIQTAKETLLALQTSTPVKPHAEVASADPRELERVRSLVLIGIPESQAELPSEQVASDQATVKSVLDQLGVETTPVACFRLGWRITNPARTGPRIIKVTLPSESFQHLCLGRWKQRRQDLRAKQDWSNLLIRPSLTPDQLKADRAEREQRRAQASPPKKRRRSTRTDCSIEMARGSSTPISSPFKPAPAEAVPEAKEVEPIVQPQKKEWDKNIEAMAKNTRMKFCLLQDLANIAYVERMWNWYADVNQIDRLWPHPNYARKEERGEYIASLKSIGVQAYP